MNISFDDDPRMIHYSVYGSESPVRCPLEILHAFLICDICGTAINEVGAIFASQPLFDLLQTDKIAR